MTATVTPPGAPPPPDEPRLAKRLRSTARFLQSLLAAPNGQATLDEGDLTEDLLAAFPDNGKWRGSIPLMLSQIGAIVRVRLEDGSFATRRSRRPCRHSGELGLWRLADRAAAERVQRDCEARLSQLPSEPRQRFLFDID